MTTPRPTVKELAEEMASLGRAYSPALLGQNCAYAADILLNCGLPLDAPYYPEPPLTSAHPGSAVGDYTWNPQKGDWEVKEIDKFICEPMEPDVTPRGPEDPLWNKRDAAAPSSPPGGVNAGAALQDGAVSSSPREAKREGIVLRLQSLARSPRAYSSNDTRENVLDAVEWMNTLLTGLRGWERENAEPPPTPTPASTAGAVEELAACPYCDEFAEVKINGPDAVQVAAPIASAQDWDCTYWVECVSCGAHSADTPIRANAIAAWNRRAAAASATIVRLKAKANDALTYAADVRWEELANGSPLTIIDRIMLRELHSRAAQALADLAGGG